MKVKTILLCFGAVLLCGCEQFYSVDISSFSQSPSLTDKTCVILSGLDKIPSSDLQFQEFKPYVQRALEHQGYKVTEDIQKAQIEILLSYSIVGPILEGYQANAGDNMDSHAVFTPSTSDKPYVRMATFFYHEPEIIYTVPANPTYIYVKTIVLEAWDARKGAKDPQGIQYWKMIINCAGRSKDLREAFPAMMAAAMDYIGSDTRRIVTVDIKESDGRILYIKGLRSTPSY